MLQAYTEDIRYWFAVRFGSLETAKKEHICEIICPDCGMKTSMDSTVDERQSCYFCDGDLLNTPKKQTEMDNKARVTESETKSSAVESTSTPQKIAN